MSTIYLSQQTNKFFNISPNFPVEALPPIVSGAINAVIANTQAPPALIASSAFAAVALACQGVIDVQRPNGMRSPVSLFFTTIADSSERKSTVDKEFTRSIRQFEKLAQQKHSALMKEFSTNKSIWEHKLKQISKSSNNAQKHGKSTGVLEQDMRELIQNKPLEPKLTKQIYADVTPEALLFGLSEHGAVGGLFCDEGGIFFDGRARSGLPLYNALWSGSPVNVDRRSQASYVLEDARLTISLMVQKSVFQNFLAQHGDMARSNGFFSRTIFAYPASTYTAPTATRKTTSGLP
jgi:hypothetical protein